ncbi:MAG: carboxypeptidase-like regulatory domain-containing protein [Acidobacteriota bacterium]|nr:carboxypeptidase-like regulatory domain-containing protein [Acidobacteriota bacterium]
MHHAVIWLAAAVCACAGTVQGVVLEQASGRVLARSNLRLEPVPKSGENKTSPLATRAGRTGQFTFQNVAAGFYVLSASRDGYFIAAYGQRLPIGRGIPIEVTADSNLFSELRLRRKGALTGHILDDNGVAMAGISVVAYRAGLPLRSAGSAISDDRGVYRIHGLNPGKYWVRSAAQTLDDGSAWLPTFGPQSREVRDARIHVVGVDADTTDADISPEPGTLFHLGGVVTCDTLGAVIVTLSSETGRRRTQTECGFPYRFDSVAPGVYEISAVMQGATPAGYVELFADRDTESANIQILQLPTVEIEVRRAGSGATAEDTVTLTGRRQDMTEIETSREIAGRRVSLAPGHWEFRARVAAGQYVESIVNLRGAPRRPWKAERPPDWYDVFIEPRFPSRIRITVSDQAGQITGGVLGDSSKPVPGIPVFLWPVAETARRSLSGPIQVLSDDAGRFSFGSLPPGDYRLLASFDVNEIDSEIIELSRAPVVHAEASQTARIDLPVWIAP